MLTLKAAQELLAGALTPLAPTTVDLHSAAGCRVAEAPVARADFPAVDVSMMDGYAVRAADTADQRPLPIAAEIAAGDEPSPLAAAAAARIFTGAVVPAGADAVVPQEDATVTDGYQVQLPRVSPGYCVRKRGEVCALDSPLMDTGALVTPQAIAALAASGAHSLRVTPRPRVGILSTGSEVVEIGASRRAGQIWDANGVMLAALAGQAQLPLTGRRTAVDDVAALSGVLDELLEQSDLVVTTGGVSVGDYDLVPRALSELGATIVFHRLSIKPGKPVLVARVRERWCVGLPGNPVSALIGWHMIAWPLAETLAGGPDAFMLRWLSAALTAPASNNGDRTVLAPALLQADDTRTTVSVLPWKGSHDVVAFARANALAVLDVGADHPAGAVVNCYAL